MDGVTSRIGRLRGRMAMLLVGFLALLNCVDAGDECAEARAELADREQRFRGCDCGGDAGGDSAGDWTTAGDSGGDGDTAGAYDESGAGLSCSVAPSPGVLSCAEVMAALRYQPRCSCGDDPGSDTGEPDGGTGDGKPAPGQLTAGEWRDLDEWEFWLGLLEGEVAPTHVASWQFFTTDRFAVIVQAGQSPVADARVRLRGADDELLWEARTDGLGRAEAFDGLFGAPHGGPYRLEVSAGSAATSVELASPSALEPIVVDLGTPSSPPLALDLMLVIDTTGSMSDELTYLQAELRDVIDRVRANAGDALSIRVSVNVYRDEGDEYVVRSSPFTETVGEALAFLGEARAGGGGDYEEAVEQALADAVLDHQWSSSARARLLFLVLDAPPHRTDAIVEDVHASVEAAARSGIRIIPVASSGVDRSTEFLLRFAAIATGGTYTFLTDDSGIGNPHLEPTIGPYQVELLNHLLVRLIGEALE